MNEFAGTGDIFDFTSLETIAYLSFISRANRAYLFTTIYSVSSLVVPKMEAEFSGTGAVKNSK